MCGKRSVSVLAVSLQWQDPVKLAMLVPSKPQHEPEGRKQDFSGSTGDLFSHGDDLFILAAVHSE